MAIALSVRKLKSLSAFEPDSYPWEDSVPSLDPARIARLVVEMDNHPSMLAYPDADLPDTEWHHLRVAQLVKTFDFGNPDGAIDIEVFQYGELMIRDGNHRLAAAVFTKKLWIYVNPSGSVGKLGPVKYRGKIRPVSDS